MSRLAENHCERASVAFTSASKTQKLLFYIGLKDSKRPVATTASACLRRYMKASGVSKVLIYLTRNPAIFTAPRW